MIFFVILEEKRITVDQGLKQYRTDWKHEKKQ